MIPCFNEYHSLKHESFTSLLCVVPQLVVDFGVSHFIFVFGLLFIALFTCATDKQSDNF